MMTCFNLQYDYTHGSSKLFFNTLQQYNNSKILKKFFFLLVKTGQVKEYKYPQAKYIHGKKNDLAYCSIDCNWKQFKYLK